MLDALTGIRAIAALWVLLFHSRLRSEPLVPEPIRNVIGLGHAAVCFFFVLSGFILAYTYISRYQNAQNKPALDREFWWARFARIYPVYFAGFVLAAVSTYLIGQTTFYADPATEVQSWILRVFGLHAWWPPKFFDGPNDPSWSLSVEFLFYGLFPFLIKPILRIPTRNLWAALSVGLALSLVGPIILMAQGQNELKVTTDLAKLISFNPVFRIPEFVVGILCGRLFLEGLVPGWVKERASLIFWGGTGLLFVLANIGISAALLRYGLTTALFALMIVAMAFQTGGAARFLSLKAMVKMGEASYALYILHRPVQIAIKEGTERFLGSTPFWAMAAYLPVAILIAFAAYHWLELPAQKALRNWYKARFGSKTTEPKTLNTPAEELPPSPS